MCLQIMSLRRASLSRLGPSFEPGLLAAPEQLKLLYVIGQVKAATICQRKLELECSGFGFGFGFGFELDNKPLKTNKQTNAS